MLRRHLFLPPLLFAFDLSSRYTTCRAPPPFHQLHPSHPPHTLPPPTSLMFLPAEVVSFLCLLHLFSFPSALRHHISTLDGESRDGVEP